MQYFTPSSTSELGYINIFKYLNTSEPLKTEVTNFFLIFQCCLSLVYTSKQRNGLAQRRSISSKTLVHSHSIDLNATICYYGDLINQTLLNVAERVSTTTLLSI